MFTVPNKHISAKGVNPTELKAGIKDEAAHTTNPRLARQISLEHLKGPEADPKYYTHLEQMENRYKQAFDRGFLKAATDNGLTLTQAKCLVNHA